MGFLGTLGKLAGVAAPLAAIPFTGGASAAWLPAAIGAGGQAASAIGAGMSAERGDENKAISDQNELLARLYGTKQNAMNQLLQLAESGALNRAKLGIEAPAARMGQLIRGSLLANTPAASISGLPARIQSRIPTLKGGLTPASLSSAARAGGGEMQRQALLALLSGSDVPAMPDYSKGMLADPKMGGYKGPSGLESALGLGGVAGSAIGSVLNRGKAPSGMPATHVPQGASVTSPIIPGSVFSSKLPRPRLT